MDKEQNEHCPFCCGEMWPHKEWWEGSGGSILVWSCPDCRFSMAGDNDEQIEITNDEEI